MRIKFQYNPMTAGESIIGTSNTVSTTVLPVNDDFMHSANTNPRISSMKTAENMNTAVVRKESA